VLGAEKRHGSRKMPGLRMIHNASIQVQFDLKCRKPLVVLDLDIVVAEKFDVLADSAAMHALPPRTIFNLFSGESVSKMHVARVGDTLHTRFDERFQHLLQEGHIRGLKGHGIVSELGNGRNHTAETRHRQHPFVT